MSKHSTLIGWPKYDPKRYRFAVPNAVWEHKLRPVEFVIFSYLCCHRSVGAPDLEMIATGVHMMVGTVKKYLDSLKGKKLVNEDGTPALKCRNKKYFTLPNEIFLLRLPPTSFVVAYLLLIESRRTHTCHPSYNTIAVKTGVSKNTAIKSISVLEKMALITLEPSSYLDKRGLKWKGNNLYTVLPVRFVVDIFYQRQFRQLEANAAKQKAQAFLSRRCTPQKPISVEEHPATPQAP